MSAPRGAYFSLQIGGEMAASAPGGPLGAHFPIYGKSFEGIITHDVSKINLNFDEILNFFFKISTSTLKTQISRTMMSFEVRHAPLESPQHALKYHLL